MATTRGNPATVTVSSGRHGWRTKLAAGAAILGCAATLVLGGMPTGDTSRGPSPIVPAGMTMGMAGITDPGERSLALTQDERPAVAATPTTAAERLLFLDRGLWPAAGGAAPSGADRTHFLEWNTIFLPGEMAPATTEPTEPQVGPR